MKRIYLMAGLMVLALSLAACGNDAAVGDVADPAAGTCLEGTPDCDDTSGHEDEPAGDEYDSDSAREEAQALLGVAEADLEPDVRIGRRGEEHMMLTEDYVLGRMTVELDINDMDEWIVTAVTVELPDGPETFTRHLQ